VLQITFSDNQLFIASYSYTLQNLDACARLVYLKRKQNNVPSIGKNFNIIIDSWSIGHAVALDQAFWTTPATPCMLVGG